MHARLLLISGSYFLSELFFGSQFELKKALCFVLLLGLKQSDGSNKQTVAPSTHIANTYTAPVDPTICNPFPRIPM